MIRTCITICLLIIICTANAQLKDTTAKSFSNKINDIFQYGISVITRTGADSSMQSNILNTKNEAPFLPYTGKGIRKIIIRQFGFEKTFTDTSKQIKYFGEKIIHHLHYTTREWVVRNNLFIKEGTALNPNLVADNERFLRSLEYIHDARILVEKVKGEPDSIDLVVVTKDFLSINAELNDASADRVKLKLGDINLAGMGQTFQITSLLEKSRNPHFGYELLYKKNSIANTFINASVGFSTININLVNRSGDEHRWFASLERPLISQHLPVAGAITFSNNQTVNDYKKPDSLFYKYHYQSFDAWIGYNLGVRKLFFLKSVKNRQFISIRYLNNKFFYIPYQVNGLYSFRFNNRQAVLGQFTFFHQNFYKTNYIYGFGITEDIPYGYNISLTTGWYKQLQMERLYIGTDANSYIVTNKGYVIQYFLRTGTFLQRGELQDAAVLAGVSTFSRIYSFSKLKIRQYLRFSYTKQFNRIGTDPLSINNSFGLRYFKTDSARGNQRISLHTETFFFLKNKILGFKFAPFAFGDIAFLSPKIESLSASGIYYGLGGGMRLRNEALVLGTVELRFIYFPPNSQQGNVFKISVNANIRFRYNSNYIKAPDIIQLNNDPENNIY